MENKEVKIESSMGERFEEFRKGYEIIIADDFTHTDPVGLVESFIQSEINLAVAKREKEIVEIIKNERKNLRFRFYDDDFDLRYKGVFEKIGSNIKFYDFCKKGLRRIINLILITNNEVVKGKYTLINDIPKWQNPDGTLEKYTHQDDNFSNMCSFVYCRCRN